MPTWKSWPSAVRSSAVPRRFAVRRRPTCGRTPSSWSAAPWSVRRPRKSRPAPPTGTCWPTGPRPAPCTRPPRPAVRPAARPSDLRARAPPSPATCCTRTQTWRHARAFAVRRFATDERRRREPPRPSEAVERSSGWWRRRRRRRRHRRRCLRASSQCGRAAKRRWWPCPRRTATDETHRHCGRPSALAATRILPPRRYRTTSWRTSSCAPRTRRGPVPRPPGARSRCRRRRPASAPGRPTAPPWLRPAVPARACNASSRPRIPICATVPGRWPSAASARPSATPARCTRCRCTWVSAVRRWRDRENWKHAGAESMKQSSSEWKKVTFKYIVLGVKNLIFKLLTVFLLGT